MIRPAEQSFGDADARRRFGAGGFNRVTRQVSKDFFGSSTAPFIAAADEE